MITTKVLTRDGDSRFMFAHFERVKDKGGTVIKKERTFEREVRQ
jgi:hypothetical protein